MQLYHLQYILSKCFFAAIWYINQKQSRNQFWNYVDRSSTYCRPYTRRRQRPFGWPDRFRFWTLRGRLQSAIRAPLDIKSISQLLNSIYIYIHACTNARKSPLHPSARWSAVEAILSPCIRMQFYGRARIHNQNVMLAKFLHPNMKTTFNSIVIIM